MRTIFFCLLFLLFSPSLLKAQQYVSTNPSNRNVIIEEFTGRNCVNCPDGHVIVNQLVDENPGRVWPVNVHAGSYALISYPNFQTVDGNAIHDGFGIDSYPTAVINRSTDTGQPRTLWSSLADEQLGQASECNVGGMALINPLTRVATITVEVYYTGNSVSDENFLTVAMLQDSVLGSQTGMNYNPAQVIGDQYCHTHILRDIVTNSPWGEAISPTTQGTLITRSFEYTIPESIGVPNGVEVDFDHIFFLAWVSECQQGATTRPILTGNRLDMALGANEAVFPFIKTVAQSPIDPCSHTKYIDVKVQNGGIETLTSLTLASEWDGVVNSVQWEGSISQYDAAIVTIPVELPFGTYDVKVRIIEANGVDLNLESTVDITCLPWMDLWIYGEEEELTLELMQDKWGEQITWEFTDSEGSVLASGGPYPNLAAGMGTELHTERVTVHAGECVKFSIYDKKGNGICCVYGEGYYLVKDSSGAVLFGDEHDGSFGESASHQLSVIKTQGLDDEDATRVMVYPNPASGLLHIDCEGMTGVEIYNALGQRMTRVDAHGHSIQVDTRSFGGGIYMLRIMTSAGRSIGRVFSVVR